MMLDSMEQFKDLVVRHSHEVRLSIDAHCLSYFQPGSEEQCEKLRVIIGNLAEQQNGYVNLLNLITVRINGICFDRIR